MELFDLYTAEREKTGKTMARGEPVPEGFYRLVVHVCIFDPQGRMLIQQRQPFKRGWSNLWDLSVGGAAVSGDTSRTAAERETREELGLDVDLSRERPSLTVHWEHGFDDYYTVTRQVDPESLCACIVQAADTISAARPGARRETIENYLKRLEKLETVAKEFKGVSSAYAIQAGREVRILVEPENIDDAQSQILAHDIAKKIENELEYPGQIKVTVIREVRAQDVAK